MTKIMLVEDDKSLREIYGVRLLAEGYDIKSAGDGEEALAMAVKEHPDLIISDVMMPKISGFDMLDILRATPETKEIKVIMMTALSSEDQRDRGESLGADRYLVKSQVGIEDVVRTVHEILDDNPIKKSATSFGTPSQPYATPTTVNQSTASTPTTTPTTPTATFQASQPVAMRPIVQNTTTPVAPVSQPTVAPQTQLPQPTAPFSTPAPASLGDATKNNIDTVNGDSSNSNFMQPVQPTTIIAQPPIAAAPQPITQPQVQVQPSSTQPAPTVSTPAQPQPITEPQAVAAPQPEKPHRMNFFQNLMNRPNANKLATPRVEPTPAPAPTPIPSEMPAANTQPQPIAQPTVNQPDLVQGIAPREMPAFGPQAPGRITSTGDTVINPIPTNPSVPDMSTMMSQELSNGPIDSQPPQQPNQPRF